jgi:hypothetical protein
LLLRGAKLELIISTPNNLTEVNSLSSLLPLEVKSNIYDEFANQIEKLNESYIASQKLCRTNSFRTFGLTTASIIEVARNGYLVFTDDFPLANTLEKLSMDVLNLNHIRPIYW